ncbi:MAG: hypothetical protein US69_C0027G0006 [candidate division TM6 bacterium GW2011_GWF2_38_10]|nr:MAG: hypothetical protein US69_C0027G0006 [candidate division TM6 bacterium GW2011_GWF2_38_10]
MNKIVKNIVFFSLSVCVLSVPLFARRGSSALGGFAGGMMGGVLGSAITQSSRSDATAPSGAVTREIDKLESAVRYDLLKIDERLRVLERSKDGAGSSGVDVTNIEDGLKKVRRTVNALQSKFDQLEEKFDQLLQDVKRLSRKIEPNDDARPLATKASVAAEAASDDKK